MSNFYTLLTRVGAALHASAQVNQTTVPWTHMRLGDGNGAAVVPEENQTGLVRQVHTLQITDISVHPDNPNWVVAEAVVPSDVGGWTVREAAIYGGTGGNTCIAVGNYPETYKPVLAEGAGREMVMRMVVQISSVATVKLQIDPAVAIASRGWVESLHAKEDFRGIVELATLEEVQTGEDTTRVVTPAGLAARTATETRAGLVELATKVEAEGGVDNTRYVTPLRVLQLLRAAASNATEALAGVLRIATQAEVDAGGLDTVMVTPKKMRAGFSILLEENGHITFPTWLGGLIIQWGKITGSFNLTPFSFPFAFTKCLSCGVTSIGNVVGNAEYAQISSFTPSTANAVTYSDIAPGNVLGTLTFGWLAIGY